MYGGGLCRLSRITVYGADVRTPAVADKMSTVTYETDGLGDSEGYGKFVVFRQPQYATRDGMLYSDMVRGDSRLCTFTMLIRQVENKKYLLSHPMRRISPLIFMCTGPGTIISEDYYGVGEELSEIYYKDKQKEYKITVQPRSTALLDERLNDVVVYPDQLFSGIVDFRVDGAAQVSSVMMPSYEDPHSFVNAFYCPVLM